MMERVLVGTDRPNKEPKLLRATKQTHKQLGRISAAQDGQSIHTNRTIPDECNKWRTTFFLFIRARTGKYTKMQENTYPFN